MEFAQAHVDGCSRLNGGEILVGQSQILRPHGFFLKQGFGALPERLQALNLKVEGCDLAHKKIEKTHEEDKNGVSEDRSDTSALTTKTQRGKHVDKHCPACDFELVRGKNWSRHCKTFHNRLIVQGVRCDDVCQKC